MLADPQSVTINAVAKTLPRVSLGPTEAHYRVDDGTVELITKQNVSTKRFRREVRLQIKKIAADPLTAVNSEVSTSLYVVVDEPKSGFSDVELEYYRAAMVAWLTAPNFLKIVTGEY